MFVLAMLAAGWLLSGALGRDQTLTERVAFAVLFGLGAVALPAVGASLWLERRVDATMCWALVAPALLAGSWLCHRAGAWRPPRAAPRDVAMLSGATLTAAGLACWYSHAEVLLALGSFHGTGTARCFQMLTFELLADVAGGAALPSRHDVDAILSTPGNVAFPLALMPALGGDAFWALYAGFGALVFLFTALLSLRWSGSLGAAMACATFAVANPYMLSIEVLDRNVIALALSGATLFAVVRFQHRPLLHGLLLGAAAGTGLRNLPLLLIAPVALLQPRGPGRGRRWALIAGGFALAFAPNVGHLLLNGLGSLGEPLDLLELTIHAFTSPGRTPLMPFHTGLGYVVEGHVHLGHIAAALVVVGAWRWARRAPRRLIALGLILVPTLAALAVQRDWIEGDKHRVVIWAWLPVLLCLGEGLVALRVLLRAPTLRGALPFVAASGASAALALAPHLPALEADRTMVDRKPIYQAETPTYRDLLRADAGTVGILPGYRRLLLKPDMARKWRSDAAIARQLVDGGALAAQRDTPFWLGRGAVGRVRLLGDEAPRPAGLVRLAIDLRQLARTPAAAVTVAPAADGEGARDAGGPAWFDVAAPPTARDLHFKRVTVPWQPQPLPVVLRRHTGEQDANDELHIELNALDSFGRDEDGFERLNVISWHGRPDARARARRAGERALPAPDEDPVLHLRVRRGTRVIVRNWIVSLTDGAVHRVDGWAIHVTAHGAAAIRFAFREPESYL